MLTAVRFDCRGVFSQPIRILREQNIDKQREKSAVIGRLVAMMCTDYSHKICTDYSHKTLPTLS